MKLLFVVKIMSSKEKGIWHIKKAPLAFRPMSGCVGVQVRVKQNLQLTVASKPRIDSIFLSSDTEEEWPDLSSLLTFCM